MNVYTCEIYDNSKLTQTLIDVSTSKPIDLYDYQYLTKATIDNLHSYDPDTALGSFIDLLNLSNRYDIINNEALIGNYSSSFFSIETCEIDKFLRASVRNICNSYLGSARRICASTELVDYDNSKPTESILYFDDFIGRFIDNHTRVQPEFIVETLFTFNVVFNFKHVFGNDNSLAGIYTGLNVYPDKKYGPRSWNTLPISTIADVYQRLPIMAGYYNDYTDYDPDKENDEDIKYYDEKYCEITSTSDNYISLKFMLTSEELSLLKSQVNTTCKRN